MNTIFIETYLFTLMAIVAVSMLIFIIGIYLILRTPTMKKSNKITTHKPETNIDVTNIDVRNIAGNDILATQLDLARAYIETDQLKAAQEILRHVMKEGSLLHQQEAQSLLASCQ